MSARDHANQAEVDPFALLDSFDRAAPTVLINEELSVVDVGI